MTEAQRHKLSRVLFALALPATLLTLAVGWSGDGWRLAYPIGMAFAWAGWWIAPAEKPATQKKRRS